MCLNLVRTVRIHWNTTKQLNGFILNKLSSWQTQRNISEYIEHKRSQNNNIFLLVNLFPF